MNEDEKTVIKTQVEVELLGKRQCSYEPYQCSQFSLDGYKYCIKHILRDKQAPFKQCNFIYQNNGKRCHLAAPKTDKKEYGYCNEHAFKETLLRNKQNIKNSPPLTAECLLTNLTHYIKKLRNPSGSYVAIEDKTHRDDSGIKNIRTLDPFVDIDATSVYNNQCNEVLDMCSESESDVEPSTYSKVWHDVNIDSSDNESYDSEDGDPFKHANVYTAEEVSLLTRDKLVRLQSLYVEQYKYLTYLLKERRRKYLHSLKREKETCCNISNQVRDNPKEQRLYKKLKEYNKYHKVFGGEAILKKRLHSLRVKISEGSSAKSPSYIKCQFSEGGVKCSEKVLPMAKHCRKHIIEDPHQVLFKACGKTNEDIQCNTPIEAIFDDSTCKLHMELPPIRSYNQPRKESESEPEDSLDLHYALPSNENVKAELMDYSLRTLPKMEALPSILFEDSAESLSSTLQYSGSDFTDNYTEKSSLGLGLSTSTENMDINNSYDNKSSKPDEVQTNGIILNSFNTDLESNENEGNVDTNVEPKSDKEIYMKSELNANNDGNNS